VVQTVFRYNIGISDWRIRQKQIQFLNQSSDLKQLVGEEERLDEGEEVPFWWVLKEK
jgi:hypothetical protein